MKKLFVVRIGNYWPELCKYTIPTIKHWARLNDYEYEEITAAKWGSVMTLEKYQVFEQAKDLDSAIIIDADCMLRPDFLDPFKWSGHNLVRTSYSYQADTKFILDAPEFIRDGRNIGVSTGMVWWTKYTNVVWEPMQEKMDVFSKIKSGNKHIADEFIMSFNIAKYGLHYDGLSHTPDLYIVHFGGTLTAQSKDEKKSAVLRAKELMLTWTELWPNLENDQN